jgi:adenosine deaminase
LKGAQEQELSYSQLKTMARTSLEHAFIGGSSLWRDGNMSAAVPPCGGKRPGGDKPSAACQKFLDGSEKARLQWRLEAEFSQFESRSWK